jgi:hypothetical protein
MMYNNHLAYRVFGDDWLVNTCHVGNQISVAMEYRMVAALG